MTGRISPQTTLRPGNPIVLRLTAVAKLSEPELDLLAELGRHRETHRAGDELLIEGDPARRPRFILSGWASNQHILSDGRRQVFNFALPGDGLGVYPRMAPPEQERLQQQMRPWAELTPDQRRAAREQYRSLRQLPPDRRDEIRQRWEQYRSLPPEARSEYANRPPPRNSDGSPRIYRPAPAPLRPGAGPGPVPLQPAPPAR